MPDPLNCRELVELVTDYLDGALRPELVERFEEHLVLCDGCTIHVEQMAETIRAAGALREEDLRPELVDSLLVAFQGWREEVRR
jgi:predicted anti-sigma-YlaC factor YlaD